MTTSDKSSKLSISKSPTPTSKINEMVTTVVTQIPIRKDEMLYLYQREEVVRNVKNKVNYIDVGQIREVKQNYARFLKHNRDRSKTFSHFCSDQVMRHLYDFERKNDSDLLQMYECLIDFYSVSDKLLFRIINRSILPNHRQEWVDNTNSYCNRNKIADQWLTAEDYHRIPFENMCHLIDDFVAVNEIQIHDATESDLLNQPEEVFVNWKTVTKISTLLLLFNNTSTSKNHLLLEQVIGHANLKAFTDVNDCVEYL